MRRDVRFNVIVVSIYLVAALALFAMLAIRASNGAFITRAELTARVTMPAAPALDANKTRVITESGVPIGVVTKVDRHEDGVTLNLKITSDDVIFRSDASARVVIINVLGDKSVMVWTGDPKKGSIESGEEIAYQPAMPGALAVTEPDMAMQPLEDALAVIRQPGLRSFLAALFTDPLTAPTVLLGQVDPETLNTPEAGQALGNLVSLANSSEQLLGSFSMQDSALSGVGTRITNLAEGLSSGADEINALTADISLLLRDIDALLAHELPLIDQVMRLASASLDIFVQHAEDIRYAVEELPKLVAVGANTTETLVHLLRNEKGYYVSGGASNLGSLNVIMEILTGAEQ